MNQDSTKEKAIELDSERLLMKNCLNVIELKHKLVTITRTNALLCVKHVQTQNYNG